MTQIYTSKLHGYDVREFKVLTKDNYELKLHRLIHPSDFRSNGPAPRTKKPYLLLHGLIGSSASWLLNVQDQFAAPPSTFDGHKSIRATLSQLGQTYQEHQWQSTADRLRRASEGQELPDKWAKPSQVPMARLVQVETDNDPTPFGRDFKQAHRKWDLPKEALPHVSNSLAFTLSNFGYDVWLLNLRGNKYSRGYNGRHSADSADSQYWDFNIDTLIREDLLATINFIQREVRCQEPVGLVSYSYSSLHVMGLLSKFPTYQRALQPIIMLAPTLLTGTAKGKRMRLTMKTVSKVLMSRNGPFPSKHESKIEELVCSLPVASKLCRLFQMLLSGQMKRATTLKSYLYNDRKTALIEQDARCGQTSKAVLHEIIDNLSRENIPPKFMAFAAQRQLPGSKVPQRSVILVHSAQDEIASVPEVEKIRDSALRGLTLADYVINERDFGHADFLFSRRNQYLVNAEVARMVLLFDHLLYR